MTRLGTGERTIPDSSQPGRYGAAANQAGGHSVLSPHESSGG
jgi:hypothetical protein